MKRALVLFLLLAPVLAFAQATPPKPQLYWIHEEIARPSMLAQYETVTREILTAFTEKKADPKVFGMQLFTTNDFHYVYVVPISSWGAMDSWDANWKAIGDSIGKEKWKDLMTRGNSAMASYNDFIVMRRDDLSYAPATPRLKTDEHRYFRWEFYYLDPARAEESEQLAKDYAALFKAKNIGDPFTIFMAVSGHDLPLLIVAVPGKSEADFAAEDDRVNATLGNDVRPLQQRALAITRKFEVKEGTFRPELSYPMPVK